MGCGSSAPAPAPTIKFLHGEPTFKGNEIVRCFDRGGGLLFRIMDTKTKQWAFYNDTTEFQMAVEIIFSPLCEIKALGNTVIEKVSNGEQTATVVVPPLATEMFIEGNVLKFRSKYDCVPVDSSDREAPAAVHNQAPVENVEAEAAAPVENVEAEAAAPVENVEAEAAAPVANEEAAPTE